MRVSPTTASAAASGIRPEHLHHYAPGEIVAEGDSGADRRRRVFYRQFRYQPSVVSGPGINSLLMVIYRQGTVLMRRRCEAAWQEKVVQPGDISVLGAGMPSDWEWDQPIEVSHVYLSHDLLAETCAHAFDQDYRRLAARDALDIRDPKSVALADMLIGELCTPSAGGALLVDTLAQTLSICAIRDHHWNPGVLRGASPRSGLTPAQKGRALEFIEAHLAHDFDLVELARAAGVSAYHFIRCFKASFGVSPYQFVMKKRLDHVVELVRTTQLSLADIALSCGFSDQSHMTRALKKGMGLTPGAMRKHGF
jgi:AraC family transcriptional regulator